MLTALPVPPMAMKSLPQAIDRIECVVPHCDPTVALHDRLVLVRGEAVVGAWRIDARGRRSGIGEA